MGATSVAVVQPAEAVAVAAATWPSFPAAAVAAAGGGGTLEPGVYMIRLTAGGKTVMSSVNVLEDIWVRPQ